MEFNKSLKNKRCGNEPSVIFRKLSGNKARYQGSINTSGIKLIENSKGKFCGLQILFSDKHSFVGFKPLYQQKATTKFFGATELFRELPLITGKHYTLKISDDVAVIDSDEFQ